MDSAAQVIRSDIVKNLIHTMNGYSATEIVAHANELAEFVISGKKPAVRVARKPKAARRKK